jgi:hypothetical protein
MPCLLMQGGPKAPTLLPLISHPSHHNNRRKTTKTHGSKPKLAAINTKILKRKLKLSSKTS